MTNIPYCCVDVWGQGPIQHVQVAPNDTVLSMTDLVPSFTYQFRVIAENRLGRSEPSDVITVTTEEEGNIYHFLGKRSNNK